MNHHILFYEKYRHRKDKLGIIKSKAGDKMRKIVLSLLSLCLIMILASCEEEVDYTKALISVYLEGTEENKAIEIYNSGSEELSLNQFKIGIYKVKDTKPSITVKLGGVLESGKCFVVCNSKSDQAILDKADMVSEQLEFNGTEGIALMYRNTVVDVIGELGLRNRNNDITYVRKVNMTEPSYKFDMYNFIIYNKDNANYLGEFINSVTPEELLAGPKFDEGYLDKEFYVTYPGMNGTGGAVEVELTLNVDGDTSYFRFPDSLDIRSFVEEKNIMTNRDGTISTKLRYQDVDTPETYTGNIQEFGWPAKLYTAQAQENADKIYIQSVANDSLLCTYGRILGYVFVCSGDDSSMINFELIKRGYTNILFDYNENMTYKDIPYYGYMMNARLYAQRNGLGLYGEKDPYWDYTKNQSIYA